MIYHQINKGATDQSVTIRILDNNDAKGTPETAVEHNTSGIDLWYRRDGAAKTSITEAALSALTDAHSDGGIEHIGDGYYRLDLPDAAVASGVNKCVVGGTVTGMIVQGAMIDLVDPVTVTSGRVNADVTHWLGTAAATPTVAGVPEVDLTHWLGTAAATPTVAGVPEVDLTHVAGSTTSVSVLATNVAAILVDTGTTLDAKIDAIDDLLDTEMPALTAAVAALQTYPKNVAVAAFVFYMEDTDGAALTGATVSCFLSKDGATSFSATSTATATEMASGWYKVALTQTEMNADEIAFRATATGARTCNLKLRTQG